MRVVRRPVVAFLAASLLFCVGVAMSGGFGEYQPTGLLGDYSGLKPSGDCSGAFIYQNPTVDKSKNQRQMIDRINIFVKEDADYKGVDPAELKELVDYFHPAVVKAISDAYPVVRERGPDVVRLRIAVTDPVPNKPEASDVSLVLRLLWVADAGAGVAQDMAGSTPFVGEATVEMEALDSRSSERTAACIETQVGRKYQVGLDEGVGKAVEEGVGDDAIAYSTFGYTKQVMDRWARLIRERLDAPHGQR